MRQKIVTKIEANPLLIRGNDANAILRVAAYCRVSTDSDDQLESYAAQVAYYTDIIVKNPRWRLVKIYADEGITGTQAKKRKHFLEMIRDCEKGKIDLILTKSVARFARNTVDSLQYVRQLKAIGVGVYFQEQNLDTLKTDNEMVIGFHSVMAQAESENISANVRWGIQQRMRTGTYAFRYNILGYRKGENGEPVIVPEEAEVVRKIYQRYIMGDTTDQLKEYLQAKGYHTKKGSTEWSKANIYSILTNERYCGDVIYQKTYVENCLTKKVKKNRGEMTKYLVTNNHPAIIEREIFKMVQAEMARRGGMRKISDKTITEQGKYSGKFALTNLLICGECGSPYRRKSWVRNGVNRKVWICVNRLDNGTEFCKHSVTLDEDKLQKAICRALKTAIQDRKDVMDLIVSNLSYALTGENDVLDSYAIERQMETIKQEIDDSIELLEKTEGDKGRVEKMIEQQTNALVVLRERVSLVKAKIENNEVVNAEVERIKSLLTDEALCFDIYDDRTVRLLVEYIRVMGDGRIVIMLKGGVTVEEKVI